MSTEGQERNLRHYSDLMTCSPEGPGTQVLGAKTRKTIVFGTYGSDKISTQGSP